MPTPLSPLQNTPEAFQAQLREGHFNELRVALFYMLKGYFARIEFDGGRYDIRLHHPDRPDQRVEVKWDKRAAETGNLYFEIKNTRQNRPSGVMSTSADIWCHVLGAGERALLVKVKPLRNFLESGNFRTISTGGADSNSLGYLVPLTHLPENAQFAQVSLPSVADFFGQLYERVTRDAP